MAKNILKKPAYLVFFYRKLNFGSNIKDKNDLIR
jgi:hypothetical protein